MSLGGGMGAAFYGRSTPRAEHTRRKLLCAAYSTQCMLERAPQWGAVARKCVEPRELSSKMSQAGDTQQGAPHRVETEGMMVVDIVCTSTVCVFQDKLTIRRYENQYEISAKFV